MISAMRQFDFDSVDLDAMARSGTVKWSAFPNSSDYPEAIGMWLAEMDLGIAPEVRDFIVGCADRGDFGYVSDEWRKRTVGATIAWARDFGWEISPERTFLSPDVLTGLRISIDRFTSAGSPVIVPTPAYMPFLTLPHEHDRDVIEVPSALGEDGLWRLDYEGIEAAFARGAELLVLCNPWNPAGRCLTRGELERLARIVDAAGGRVFEDCVHLPLLLDGAEAAVYGALDVASRHTVTAVAASKGWNIPGLKCAQIVFADDGDAAAFAPHAHAVSAVASTLGVQTAAVCYEEAGEWNRQLRGYLSGNRDLLEARVAAWDGVRMGRVEGTYIAFLDFAQLAERGAFGDLTPAQFFARHAGVTLTEGRSCGRGFESSCRMIFATSTAILTEALNRMERTRGVRKTEPLVRDVTSHAVMGGVKVSEIAYLAGTTVRTVRWYHRIGLLSIPEGRPRDYGFDHLARLVHIRWLAQSGMSLKAVGQILDGSPEADARDDLDSALARIDEEIRSLKAQRERIAGLRELAGSGAKLSPIPASLDQFYARVREHLTDPEQIEILDRDRVLAALGGTSYTLPDLVGVHVTEADVAKTAEAIELFAQARRAADSDDLARLVDRFLDIYTELAERIAGQGFAEAFASANDGPGLDRLLTALRVAYPDGRQQAFIELCLRKLAIPSLGELGGAEPDRTGTAPTRAVDRAGTD